jgi:hypothetical protein
MMPESIINGVSFPLAWALIIGNNKYYGPSIANCIEQAEGKV